MRKTKNKAKFILFARIIFVVSLFVLLFLSGFKFFSLNEEYQKEVLIQTTELNKTQSIKIHQNTLNFLEGKESLDYFNQNEKSHMQDVKNVFSLLNNVFWSSLILLFLSTIALILKQKKKIKKELPKLIYVSSFLSLFLILIIVVFSFLDFSLFFEKFHTLFFSGNWKFPIQSLLIQIYQQEFFQKMFFSMISFSVLLSLILILASLSIERIINKKPIFKHAKTNKKQKIK